MKIKTRFFAVILGVITAGVASIRAQSVAAPATAPAPIEPPPPSLSVTAAPTYVTSYMFRGQRLGGQSIQASLEADYGNLALGVWANSPINNANEVPGQSAPEIDPYGSYIINITDSLSIQPGFTWYTYPKAPLEEGYYRMTLEPNIAVNYTAAGVKFTPKYYYDLILHTATYEFNVAYAVPLKSVGTELDFTGTAGTYLGTDIVNTRSFPGEAKTSGWGNYWLAGVSVPFTLTSYLKFVVGWAYTQGTDAYVKTGTLHKATNTEAVGRGVGSAGFTWSF